MHTCLIVVSRFEKIDMFVETDERMPSCIDCILSDRYLSLLPVRLPAYFSLCIHLFRRDVDV